MTTVIFQISSFLESIGMHDKSKYLNDYIGVPYQQKSICVHYIRNPDPFEYDLFMIEFLQSPEVMLALNTSDRPYFVGQSESCNSTIRDSLMEEQMMSIADSLKELIVGLKILIFKGDKDFISNILSEEYWLIVLKSEDLDVMMYGKYKE